MLHPKAKDEGDLVAVPHGGQRLFPNELSRHPAVRQVVQLLKNDASEQGNAEFPQNLLCLSHG